MKKLPVASLLLALWILLPPCLGQEKEDKEQKKETKAGLSLQRQIAEIRKARTAAELCVGRLKARLKVEDPDYQEARDRYDTAYSEYDGWVSAVSLAIRHGQAKNLRRDPEYQSIADHASKTVQDFIVYAKKTIRKTEIPPSPFAPHVAAQREQNGERLNSGAIGKFKQIGLAIWEIFKKIRDEKRKEMAEMFEETVKWRPWEQINAFHY